MTICQNDPEGNYAFGTYKDTYKLYEDGKHRRYELLFAVNGGGFAIVSLFKDVKEPATLFGCLTISQVAFGMFLFTLLMYADIVLFGLRMRGKGRDCGKGWTAGIFSPFGAAILTLLCVMIVLGWARAMKWF
jgi:hypothetical protein